MNLRDYLHVKRITQTEFAKQLNVTRNFVSLITNGKRFPSSGMKKLIEIVTQGQVSIKDWEKKSDKK